MKIEHLKQKLGLPNKINLLRVRLALFEKESKRRGIIKNWKRAAQLVTINSYIINKEFQNHSNIKIE